MERHVTPTSRLAGMEDATAAALAENDKVRAIEAKMNSPEVQALNDKAQMEIYGDQGRDYTYKKMIPGPDGTPVETEVSTKDYPVEGKIEEIRANRRFGKTQAERDKAADKYSNDIQDLLSEGYELAQAKLIMDLRESDLDKMGDYAGKMIKDGENPLVAWKKARDLYGKKDDQRKKMILGEGLVTAEEYDAFRKGEPADTEEPEPIAEAPEPTTLDKMEAVEFTDDEQEAMDSADADAKAAREAYEDIKIRREGRAFNFKKGFRKGDMEAAYNAWMAAEQRAGAIVAKAYEDRGFNMNTQVGGGNPDREDMKTLKGLAALTTIDAHTESIKAKIEASNDSLSKITKKVAELYANFGAVEPGKNPAEMTRREKLGIFGKKVVKLVALAGVGAGTAIALSPLLTGLAGVGAAGAVAGMGISRVARGGLLAKIKKVENSRLGAIRADEDREAARRIINADMARDSILEPSLQSGANKFYETSEKVTSHKKKRLAISIGAGAVGGALANGYGDDIIRGVKGGLGKVGDAADWAWEKLPFTDNGDGGSSVGAGGDDDTVGSLGGVIGKIPKPPVGDGDTIPPLGGTEPTLGEIIPVPTGNGLTDYEGAGFSYPWNWAENQFGASNAAAELHRLGDLASQNGYDVVWHNAGDGNGMNDWISINGRSDTNYILNILDDFRQNAAEELPSTR